MDFSLSGSEVPIPAALPLFVTGIGALGLLGWRRKTGSQGTKTEKTKRESTPPAIRPRSLSCLRFSCARARPRGQRFRSGGAGIKLWGSFGARRSKPLAAGLFVACVCSGIFGLPRPCSLSLGVRAPRRRAANGGHRAWPTTRLAAAFFFGLGDRAVAELFANRRRSR